jgi:hypothetical protein
MCVHRRDDSLGEHRLDALASGGDHAVHDVALR